MSKQKIRWEKILNDDTGRSLTVPEYAIQAVLVGGLMIAFFIGFAILK